jgi:hypothetical protein
LILVTCDAWRENTGMCGKSPITWSKIISDEDDFAIWIACLSAKSPAGVPACGTRIFLYNAIIEYEYYIMPYRNYHNLEFT